MTDNDNHPVVLLTLIGDRLRELDTAIVGGARMDGDVLLVQDGKLRLSASFPAPAPDTNPAIVHAHVAAHFHDVERPMTACIVTTSGLAANPLVEAADRWLTLAAPPVLSWLNGRAVLDAHAFDGNDSWGVPGGAGYAGPLSVMLVPSKGEIPADDRKRGEGAVDYLQSQPLYLNAMELAADTGTHMVKVTFNNTSGDWRRSLELDDHAVAIEDLPWPPVVPGISEIHAPRTFPQAILAGFAIFSRTLVPATYPCATIDAALLGMMEYFSKHGIPGDELTERTVREAGIDAGLAPAVAKFAAIAFGRVMTAHLGVSFPDTYRQLHANGTYDTGKLSDECVFQRAGALAPGFMFSPRYAEIFQKIALSSPEVSAINQALWNNSDPKALCCSPSLFLDADVSEKTLRRALEEMFPAKRSDTYGKKWWQFWK